MITVMSIEDIMIYYRHLGKTAQAAGRSQQLSCDDAAYYQMQSYVDGSYDGHPKVKRAMQARIEWDYLTIEELM